MLTMALTAMGFDAGSQGSDGVSFVVPKIGRRLLALSASSSVPGTGGLVAIHLSDGKRRSEKFPAAGPMQLWSLPNGVRCQVARMHRCLSAVGC